MRLIRCGLLALVPIQRQPGLGVPRLDLAGEPVIHSGGIHTIRHRPNRRQCLGRCRQPPLVQHSVLGLNSGMGLQVLPFGQQFALAAIRLKRL